MRDFKLLKSLKLRIGEREYREISSRYTVITFQILKIFRAKIVRVVVLSLSVCVFLCFSHEPHERVSLLSPIPSRRRLLRRVHERPIYSDLLVQHQLPVHVLDRALRFLLLFILDQAVPFDESSSSV